MLYYVMLSALLAGTSTAVGGYLQETCAQVLRQKGWAELRLPLHAEGDAWGDLARWSHAARRS